MSFSKLDDCSPLYIIPACFFALMVIASFSVFAGGGGEKRSCIYVLYLKLFIKDALRSLLHMCSCVHRRYHNPFLELQEPKLRDKRCTDFTVYTGLYCEARINCKERTFLLHGYSKKGH